MELQVRLASFAVCKDWVSGLWVFTHGKINQIWQRRLFREIFDEKKNWILATIWAQKIIFLN